MRVCVRVCAVVVCIEARRHQRWCAEIGAKEERGGEKKQQQKKKQVERNDVKTGAQLSRLSLSG